jgi:peptidoglycan pentaglycine glycine transferase (the first glycine)
MIHMQVESSLGEQWNQLISVLPGAHVLQTWQWGQFKSAYGWQPENILWREQDGLVRAAALALTRVAPGGFKVMYLPRGPLLDWSDASLRAQVLDGVEALARRRGVIFIKMDPEVVLGWGVLGSADDRPDPLGAQVTAEWQQRGWRSSPDQVQFRNTAWLELAGSEDDWLARMKSKTRYNLRLAMRKGVAVRAGSEADLANLYHMYAETSVRDGFVIRPERYYTSLWRMFMRAGLAHPLIAEVEGEAVAGLVLFAFARRAWYLYGMSRDAHRDKMPNYLLQWEAMRRAKAAGCDIYDLWGAPDVFDESDSMWGVFRFKEGLGAEVVRSPGAWDFTSRPLLYDLYTRLLPWVLDKMRRRGKEQTRRQLNV